MYKTFSSWFGTICFPSKFHEMNLKSLNDDSINLFSNTPTNHIEEKQKNLSSRKSNSREN